VVEKASEVVQKYLSMVQESSKGTGLLQMMEKRPLGPLSLQNKKTWQQKTTTTRNIKQKQPMYAHKTH